MTKLISFEKILEKANKLKNSRGSPIKKHLLLGNGYSIACRNDIFSYTSLFERADFSTLSKHAKQAFNALETNDFEVVMSNLRSAAKLALLYSDNKTELSSNFEQDAEGLRDVLVKAITENHPNKPSEISDDEYRNCQIFLSNFNNIYTLNYDLLLYWALMSTDQILKISCDDGFRKPDDYEMDYVTWLPENSNKQSIFYLHGALHLFDTGNELKKFTWINTGIPLIDQISEALNSNFYPCIVSEGKSEEKLKTILHNAYLFRCYRSFASISGCLFIYGHSLDENDKHILKLIEKGKISHLYIGIYGDSSTKNNQVIIRRANKIKQQRTKKNPLEIEFFDAATASIWNRASKKF